MAAFRFIGDPRDKFSGPDIIEFDGVKIDRREFTTVPDDMAEKLRGNNHFEEFRGVTPAQFEPPPASVPTIHAPEPAPVKKRGWPAGRPRTPRI